MKNLVKYYGLTLLSLCLVFAVNAQSYVDAALLFGRTNAGGTARIQGLGGAQVSLGGDPSLANSNPAGLGMSNRSSFSVSGGFLNNSALTDFYGETTPADKFNLQIPQLGVILHKENDIDGFKGGTFAFNYTRTDNYHQNISYNGSPDNNSIIDHFLDQADGLNPAVFGENGSEYNTLLGLGWWTFLIDTIYDAQAGQLYYDTEAWEYPATQGEDIDIRGRQNQWNFSYGGNYKDRLFFGFGVGITNVLYEAKSTFYETYSVTSNLASIYIDEELTISGNGINATLGLIGRPVDFIQVGFSYTTPTKINLNDRWAADVEANWDGYYNENNQMVLDTETASSDYIVSDYRMTSPAKLSFGATGFLGKHGFITADIEKIDFSGIRLNSSDFSMSPENQEVIDRFESVINYRLGAEFRYEIFRIRGGVAAYGNPYQEEIAFDPRQNLVSGGFGIRRKNSYFDIAIVRSNSESGFYPYTIQGAGELAHSKLKETSAIVTFGWNF